MSLESQDDEAEKLITSDTDITVLERFEEAMSAKQPGRPVFNEMLDRIERGEAECIIAWHPDRLARNAVDGGRIIHLLDQGKIKDLRFSSYSFENTPQGKFMLTIIFGYSKYYVDNLSQNVRRGLRAKIRQGWRPNLAPIGYRNCKETGTIITDGHHFITVQKIFALLLSSRYTVPQIHRIVCEEWGYTTPLLKTRGGKRPGLSTMYRILSNPFYAGYLKWRGQLHEGAHHPAISKSEFETAQQLLGRSNKPRPKRLSFTYGGLFHCGACGLAITAERKCKPNGRRYTYYHCTRVHRTPKCTQPSVEERELDQQASAFVASIQLPESSIAWLTKQMVEAGDKLAEAGMEMVKQLNRRASDLKQQIANLTDLRVRELVTDDEFAEKREALKRETAVAEEKAAKAERGQVTFEPIQVMQILLSRAADWLSTVDEQAKRDLLKILCSNPTIRDKKAVFGARNPFRTLKQLTEISRLCGDVNDVQITTPCADAKQISALTRAQLKLQLHKLAVDPETKEVAEKARAFIERVEPELLNELHARSSDRSSRS